MRMGPPADLASPRRSQRIIKSFFENSHEALLIKIVIESDLAKQGEERVLTMKSNSTAQIRVGPGIGRFHVADHVLARIITHTPTFNAQGSFRG
jgi:hypothetical protein